MVLLNSVFQAFNMRSLISSFSSGYDFVNLIFKVANRTLYNLKKSKLANSVIYENVINVLIH
jgi:hypothetical protein